jgi:hypothetical protein
VKQYVLVCFATSKKQCQLLVAGHHGSIILKKWPGVQSQTSFSVQTEGEVSATLRRSTQNNGGRVCLSPFPCRNRH